MLYYIYIQYVVGMTVNTLRLYEQIILWNMSFCLIIVSKYSPVGTLDR